MITGETGGRDDKSGGVETTKTDMTSDSYTCSGTGGVVVLDHR